MDKQKKLRVFYSDISALRDRSDQPQLWEFLCCARQQKIKQCKNEDDRLRAFGAGLLLQCQAEKLQMVNIETLHIRSILIQEI